jgi:ABC-2 type transport system permease protein
MGLQSIITNFMQRHGVDARQLATLVVVYLKQDLRGGRAFMQFGAREYVRSNMALLMLSGMYIFFGFLMGAVVFATTLDVFHYSTFIHTFTLLVVALAILAESGNVIFNEKETDVLGHLPISSRTYFAAKVLNLFLFTLLLAAAANLFPAILGVWAIDANLAFGLAHALTSALVALFATALIVVSYGLLMRYVSRERFDSIITYSQVALILFFMFGFQILPRVLGANVMYFTPDFRWYYLLYPPAWFAGMNELLIGNFAPRWLAFAGLATVALVVLGAVAIRKVARDYASFVSSLAYSESASASNLNDLGRLKPRTEARAERAWKALFLANTTERAVFELVSIYLRRNREVKVRLYPSLAYFIFIPLLAVLTEGLPDPFVNEGARAYPLMGALMICYVALTAIEGMIFSEHHPAAYIYRVAPVAALGDIHNGFRKAVMIWVALPGFAMVFVLYSILWRNPLHAALVLAPWMLITPAVLMVPFLRREALPLSRKYQKGQQTARNFAVFLFCFIGLSVVAMIQVVAITGRLPVVRTSFPYWLFLALTVMTSGVLYVLLRLLSGEANPVEPSDQWS